MVRWPPWLLLPCTLAPRLAHSTAPSQAMVCAPPCEDSANWRLSGEFCSFPTVTTSTSAQYTSNMATEAKGPPKTGPAACNSASSYGTPTTRAYTTSTMPTTASPKTRGTGASHASSRSGRCLTHPGISRRGH